MLKWEELTCMTYYTRRKSLFLELYISLFFFFFLSCGPISFCYPEWCSRCFGQCSDRLFICLPFISPKHSTAWSNGPQFTTALPTLRTGTLKTGKPYKRSIVFYAWNVNLQKKSMLSTCKINYVEFSFSLFFNGQIKCLFVCRKHFKLGQMHV